MARFELFRVRSIPVTLDATWLVIFALVTLSLAAGYFPETHPGWPTPLYVAVAVVTSLLFFACLVVHELAHAGVASHEGVPIESITLFVFGGVAHMPRDAPTPGAELRIAVAGPATSLALAVVFKSVAALAAGLPVVAAPAAWLGNVNALIAVFNLIPGFPLDGGRILRAVVWWWTGDVARATQVATVSGQLVASTLIVLGMVTALQGHLFGGVWLGVIGWFLLTAARHHGARAGVAGMLQEITVEQTMTRRWQEVTPGTPLTKVADEALRGPGRRCFLVIDEGRLAGVLTVTDIRRVPRARRDDVRVADVAIAGERLVTVAPHESALVALERMERAGIAQLPVVDQGDVVGLVDRAALVDYVRTRAELFA